MKIEAIAKACHAAHNEILASIDPDAIIKSWRLKSGDHHYVVIDSIRKILNGTIKTPEQAHKNFITLKAEMGFTYGAYSDHKRTSPRITPWSELDPKYKQLDEMFFNIVSSFK